MSKLEDLQPGLRLAGLIPGATIAVIAVQPHGGDAIELTYKTANGELGQRVLGRDAEENLTIAHAEARPLDAAAADFKLVAECQRIKLAGLFDPMLAVTSSAIRPLPHQLRAVYGELLPRTPLRFLLADDPGAGKTIMAGLYVKELIWREDVRRCLIVAPGGLVDQWQDELYLKFGLAFEIFTPQIGETAFGASAFERHPFLIARMISSHAAMSCSPNSRSPSGTSSLSTRSHRMSAHYFGGKLEKTRRFQLGEMLGGILLVKWGVCNNLSLSTHRYVGFPARARQLASWRGRPLRCRAWWPLGAMGGQRGAGGGTGSRLFWRPAHRECRPAVGGYLCRHGKRMVLSARRRNTPRSCSR